MLAIQPTGISQTASKYQNFKGESYALDDETYSNKRRYYESQRDECDELIEDKYLPRSVKNAVKVGKVVAEGSLEGWAVAWAATKGAKFSKTMVVKILNNKMIKNLASKVGDLGSLAKVKSAPLLKDLGAKYTKLLDKLGQDKYGKYLANGIKGAEKITNKIGTTLKGFTYDKATKITATTLGVGSGLAGAYNAGKENFGNKNADNVEESYVDLEMENNND